MQKNITLTPFLFCLFFVFLYLFTIDCMALPKGFVYLKDVDDSILQDMRYATSNNFIGRPIKGYDDASQCILTEEAALALAFVQEELRKKSLGLKVYDCYRPQMAVDDFVNWSQDTRDQKMKHFYYPKIDKTNVFKLGYVAMKSSHTRGSTVDLTVVRLASNQKPTELAMGTHFDFMDKTSHPTAKNISKQARLNRSLLQEAMLKGGFAPLDTEWWHFTLKDEPFPEHYFNFPVS